MSPIVKIVTGLAILSLVFTVIFAYLPFEYDILPLSTWHTALNDMVDFFNDTLGLFSSFFDITMLLIVMKVMISLYVVGFNIKLIQWVVKFVS